MATASGGTQTPRVASRTTAAAQDHEGRQHSCAPASSVDGAALAMLLHLANRKRLLLDATLHAALAECLAQVTAAQRPNSGDGEQADGDNQRSASTTASGPAASSDGCVGPTTASATEPIMEPRERLLCTICLEYLPVGEFAMAMERFLCSTRVCTVCLIDYCTHQIRSDSVRIDCPSASCGPTHQIPDEVVQLLVSPTDWANWTLRRRALLADPTIMVCPHCAKIVSREAAGVGRFASAAKPDSLHKGRCPKCGKSLCFRCRTLWHRRMTCEKNAAGDAAFRRYIALHASRCPGCKTPIERISGCDHMQCSICRTSFCYRCSGRMMSAPLIGDHQDRWSLLGCRCLLLPNSPVSRVALRSVCTLAMITLVAPVVGLSTGLSATGRAAARAGRRVLHAARGHR